MTIRLYIDEDSMSRGLVRALRARGVDVITALDADMIEREDKEHLDYAMEQGRVLYTFNVRDFYRLHASYVAQGKPHAGIILARQQQYPVGEQMRRLLKLMTRESADQMKNRVEFLGGWD